MPSSCASDGGNFPSTHIDGVLNRVASNRMLEDENRAPSRDRLEAKALPNACRYRRSDVRHVEKPHTWRGHAERTHVLPGANGPERDADLRASVSCNRLTDSTVHRHRPVRAACHDQQGHEKESRRAGRAGKSSEGNGRAHRKPSLLDRELLTSDALRIPNAGHRESHEPEGMDL